MPRRTNHGLRKRCGCPRTRWPKCPHGWHFNFHWKGVSYRLSLDRECGGHISTKTAAEQEADRIRNAIRDGKFHATIQPAPTELLTFRQFAEIWKERRGFQLVNSKDNRHRLEKINSFVLPGTNPPLRFGDKRLDANDPFSG